jgi:hypothetical protein
VEYKTLLKMDSVEVTQSKRGAISFEYGKHSDAMFDLYLRITQLEEALGNCKHQASFCVGSEEALRNQLAKVREIANEALNT